MASVDDSPGNAASKKRLASRQITKDDDPDLEEEVPVEGGSFRKAPDSVLANRRILKVRRTGSTAASAPAAANPFASIRLVPSAAQVTPVETHLEVSIEVHAREDEIKEIIAPVAGEDNSQGVPEPSTEPVTEPVTNTVTETMLDTVTAADSSKVCTISADDGKPAGVPTDVKAGDNGSFRGAVGTTVSSSETFQQLSSAKNAFSASFATGFSATSIAFGSNQSTSAGFGSLNGGVSFASGSAFSSSLFGSGFGRSAFPALNSVFEKTNENNTFQFSGSGAAAVASPARVAPSSTGITLQEVPLETGEEEEKAVFSADASLFEFLDGGWKERGKGEIKISVPEDVQRRSRLVMRSKGNLRLLLNANIFPDMKITKMDNRGVTFVCANATGGDKVGFTTYALKLRDPQVARDFMSTVEAHKTTAINTEPRTPESSPKAVDRSLEMPEVSKDVDAAGGGTESGNVKT